MDLLTAVAASMLPASRSRVAAAFKALRHDHGTGQPFLELLWAILRNDAPASAVVLESMDNARRAIDTAAGAGIHPVAAFDPEYPPLLACTPDPPPVLWTRGNREVLPEPAIAVVGSRAATPYALQVAARLGAELAERGLIVVSGLARGVDSAAHRGCLRAGGRTVALLGSGVDRVYPPEHAELADDIALNGLVAAELGPGAAPLPDHFPLRNRLISGISLATVVVEASEYSGSLITARCALEQGRDVMAVPGSVLTGRNRGSHALLKDGARVVESADDILQELSWPVPGGRKIQPKQLIAEPLLAKMEPGELYGLEELVEATGMDGASLLARLTDLELAGVIAASGGRFVRRV
jgi:DNA processing protein